MGAERDGGAARGGRAVRPARTARANEEPASAGSWRSAAWICAAISQTPVVARWHAHSSDIVQQPEPAELPARRGVEEVAIARARVAGGRRVRASPQDPLIDL